MTPQWFNLIQPAAGSNTSDDVPIPEARLTAAGGVYPGSNQLWLSMGEGQSGRKLSDTWVLQVNNTDDSIAGRVFKSTSNFIKQTFQHYFSYTCIDPLQECSQKLSAKIDGGHVEFFTWSLLLNYSSHWGVPKRSLVYTPSIWS